MPVVPAALRKQVLGLVPDKHLFVNRWRAIAHEDVWWPTVGSRETVGTNILHHKGMDYLLLSITIPNTRESCPSCR